MHHLGITRGTSWRRRSIALLALSVLIQACSTDFNPLGAAPPTGGSPPPVENPPVADPPPNAPPGILPATWGSLDVLVTGATPVQAQLYDLIVRLEGGEEAATIRFRGGTTRRTLQDGAYSGSLISLYSSCTVEDGGSVEFEIVAGEISVVGFPVACETVVPAGIYERTEPEGAGFWEQFVLAEDGSFRLQYPGGFAPFGTYSAYREADGPPVVRFDFPLFGGPSGPLFGPDALGTLDGDCLTVKYSMGMMFSDFENGVFCRT